MAKKGHFTKKFSLYLVLTLALAYYFFELAQARLIARDEGFYVYAAKLILEGKTLYLDFFYPQMPLLPYLLAGWMKIFGITWTAARTFAACCTLITAILLFKTCKERMGTAIAGLAILLFSTSNFVFPWYLTAQTYAPSVLFLFAAYFLIARKANDNLKPIDCIGAGLLFGLSINIRLFFAGVGPCFILYFLFTNSSLKSKLHNITAFSFATLLALAPNAYFLIAEPETYYFNNLGYHLLRSAKTFEESLRNKSTVLRVLFGLKDSIKFDAPQAPLLLYGVVLSLLITLWKRKKIDLAFYLMAGLFILNLLPTPTYVQYFATLIPFLCIGIAHLLYSIFYTGTLSLKNTLSTLPIVIGAVLYTKAVPKDIERYTETGTGVIGIQTYANAQNWEVDVIQEIARKINSHSAPEDTTISYWPGYLLETHTKSLPGLENHFAYNVASKLKYEDRKRFHVITKKDIRSEIEAGSADLVLFTRGGKRARGKAPELTKHYEIVDQHGAISIHKKNQKLTSK